VAGTPKRRGPDWRPSLRGSRGYSWPPFEEGNAAALTHGAFSAGRVQPVADALAEQLAETAPWTAQPAFRAVVASWAYAEAQAALLRLWLDREGVLDDEGAPRPATALLEKVESRAAHGRGELGLTPASWARLVARLGSADAEHAARGLESLRRVGAELVRSAALPSLEEVHGD